MNNEEVAATKRGLSVMKDLGATDEELRVAEKNLGLAKKTYDQSFWGGVKKHAANIIQIPSRRA